MSKKVEDLMLKRLDRIEDLLLNSIVPTLAGLKVKAAVAGGMAGLVGTGLISLLVKIWG